MKSVTVAYRFGDSKTLYVTSFLSTACDKPGREAASMRHSEIVIINPFLVGNTLSCFCIPICCQAVQNFALSHHTVAGMSLHLSKVREVSLRNSHANEIGYPVPR